MSESNKKSNIEKTVIPVVYPIDKLVEMKGWAEFWDRFEDAWNTKSGIGESYGELIDSGVHEECPEVTINITAYFKKGTESEEED